MLLVLGILCVEWTTAAAGLRHAVMKKMTFVLPGARKERTVGGKEIKEEICADVGEEAIVVRPFGISMEAMMWNLKRLGKVYWGCLRTNRKIKKNCRYKCPNVS